MISKNPSYQPSINKFSIDSKLSHIPCFNCRRAKRKCSRSLPNCGRCLLKGLSCCYQDDKLKKEGDVSSGELLSFKQYQNREGVKDIERRKSEDRYKSYQFKVEQVTLSSKNNMESWKPVNLLKKILCKSKIDRNERLFIKRDGDIEYYGSNIFGNIITIFHTLKKGDSKVLNKINLISSRTNLIQPYRQLIMDREYLINEAIEAYFEHYNPYLNYMDETIFNKDANSLLKNVVTIIGLRYLNQGQIDQDIAKWLGQQIQQELKIQFYKPSLSLVITLTLVSQFIGIPGLFKAAYLFTGVASRMAQNLGLHQLPKNHSKLSKDYLRMRYSTWQMCWFNEKMHALLLNRPTIITDNLPSFSFQGPDPLPLLSSPGTKTEHKLARNAISLIYYINLIKLGTLIGLYFACVKVHFPANPEKAPHLCLIMLKRMSDWYRDLVYSMKNIWDQQPLWVYDLSQHFSSYSLILYHCIRLHLLNYFLKSEDILKKYDFIKEIIYSSTSIILIAEKLKEAYFQNGTTNRFFCLCCAILSLNYLCQSKEKEVVEQCQPLLIKAIRILYNARFKFPIVEDFFYLIPEIVNMKAN
ncbi:hypothetical protein K502DRAFT_49612 [Neoconidiobolus thromboides FSU 785]|nr:hypothetical protein K502DRAFT_49612 [Neoconidiobolus thromboides FSU 785]